MITGHINANALMEPLQTAYRSRHSREMALTYVMNDILSALDSKMSDFLMLLDLLAALDTIDQDILLQSLAQHIDLNGTVFWCFESYLEDQTQFLSIASEKSTPQTLAFGVPQGSVLGSIFFTIYTLPISDA